MTIKVQELRLSALQDNMIDQANEENLLDREFRDIPVLVFNRHFGLIALCNHLFAQLVGLSVDDIKTHHVSQVFPYIDIKTLEPHSVINLDLLTSNNDLFSAVVSVDHMTEDGETVLLKIREYSPKVNAVTEKTGGRFEDILSLTKLSEELDIEEAQRKSVHILRNIFQADLVTLYWIDDKEPVLRVRASYDPNHTMPSYLPATDLVMLSKPIIWRKDFQLPGYFSIPNQVLKLNYLVSIPLGIGDGITGLILIGDSNHEPISGIKQMMELARVNLNSTISHFILTGNLFDEIKQLKSLIELRNQEVELLKDGIIAVSADLKILEVNQAIETMLGYSKEEIIGLPVEDILIGPAILYSALQNAVQGVASHNLGTLQIHHRTGYPISVQMQIIPILQNDQLDKIIILVSDVSEFEQITLRTQQLEHRAILGEFISAFAHDVRNPINNMTSSLQLLNHTLSEDAHAQKIISRLNEDCDRLTHLMESFLSFSRLVDIRNFEDLDVGMLLKKVCSKWKPSLENSGIQLFLDIPDDLPKIRADKRSLERVFVNLISNAVEATEGNLEDRPLLSVKVDVIENQSVEKRFLQVSISDNGKGVPEKEKDHIFEPFYTTKQEGTGLGLAISKQIVTAHQGSITLDSYPGGTVFYIKLPIMEEKE